MKKHLNQIVGFVFATALLSFGFALAQERYTERFPDNESVGIFSGDLAGQDLSDSIDDRVGINATSLDLKNNYLYWDFDNDSNTYAKRVSGDRVQYTHGGIVVLQVNDDRARWNVGIGMAREASDPCASLETHSFFFNSTNNIPCYCDESSVDKKMSDDTACF